MGLFQRLRNKLKKINFFLIIIIAFAVYITFFSDYNYMKVVEYENEIKQLKAEIKACSDSIRLYQERLDRLDSDPADLERIVREEYHMKRDKEDLYIIK